MSEIKLKPCPFCGGEAVIHVGDGVCVICKECECRTISLVDVNLQGKPCGGAIYRVIEKWNRRADNETDRCRRTDKRQS